MILNQAEINVETSKQFESTDFRIDPRYRNKVLWMLINQYRFKVRTPIQEIVSNARDAQRENGNPDRPIKITLPTKLEPTFKVRDYGVGMNENRIKTIFTSFGASTKNADNSQTGGFGIGAKSPLAYTDSFNIKTYVDGTYWFYVVAKTKNEGISINLLSSGETTEENGTEVQIPVAVQDTRKFIEAASRTTMFWDVQPEFNLDEKDLYKVTGGTEIAEGFKVYNSEDLGNMFDADMLMVVDGIPYEVDSYLRRKVKHLEKITDMIHYRSKAVIRLNTGDIDLLQTRESIDETERTVSELQKIGFKAFSDLELYLASCYTDKTLQGRLKQYIDLKKKFRKVANHKFETFTFSGGVSHLDSKLNLLSYDFQGITGRVTKPRKQTYWRNELKHDYLNNIYWDDLGEKESDTMKARRLRYFIESTNADNVTVIRQGTATNFVYLRTLRLAGAKKLSSLPFPPKAVRSSKGTYVRKPKTDKVNVHLLSWGHYCKTTRFAREIKLADNTTKFIYIGYHDYNSKMDKHTWLDLFKLDGLTPCRLSESVIKKIKDDPNFIHIDAYMENFKASQDVINQVIYSQVKNSYYYDDVMDGHVKFISENITRIKDKVLKKMVQYVNIKKEGDYSIPRDLREQIVNENQKRIKMLKEIKHKIELRMLMYPLVDYGKPTQANVSYINAMYRSMF